MDVQNEDQSLIEYQNMKVYKASLSVQLLQLVKRDFEQYINRTFRNSVFFEQNILRKFLQIQKMHISRLPTYRIQNLV